MQTRFETFLRIFLRIAGSIAASALLFAFAPYELMDMIHNLLKLGSLPDEPVVGYLTRSTSFLYAMVGGMLWMVSFDLRRFRPMLIYLGCAMAALGLFLTGVDWSEDLPDFWKYFEGPFDFLYGMFLVWSGLRIPKQTTD